MAVAIVLIGAIIAVNNNTKETETKYKAKVRQLETQTKTQHNLEVENLKKEIQERDRKYKELEQTKAAEKARLAAQEASERTLAQKVVNYVAPTVQAATGSCSEWMVAAGVTDMANAAELIRRESGCNPNAVNRSSGACGIPQALPCSKLGTNDPVAQIRWMQNYVNARYGGWAGAVAFWNAHNWY